MIILGATSDVVNELNVLGCRTSQQAISGSFAPPAPPINSGHPPICSAFAYLLGFGRDSGGTNPFAR